MIVVCPTAVQAPWAAPVNDSFVMAVLEEVLLLYNVDENRIYLTGHSMGGFGTWHFGPKYCHLWAAFAPMAGGGSGSFKLIQDTNTGVYLYHGADDNVVSCSDSRRAGETMRKEGMDFVYTELPNSGHGCPQEVVNECFDFFEARRLAAAPGRAPKGKFTLTKEPLSSFDRKVTKDERDYLGDPLKDESATTPLPALIADLKKGGGKAEAAAEKLAATKDVKALAPLSAILTEASNPRDVRSAAAKVLGAIGTPEALPPLTKALAAEDVRVTIAAAGALGRIGDKKALPSLKKALRASAEFLKSKLTAKNKIDYPDWETVHDLAGALVRALSSIGDVSAAPDIAAFPGEGLLLADFDVSYSTRAGQHPDTPRRALATLVADALDRLAEPSTSAFREKLRARFGESKRGEPDQ
jgi:hypothetical protein